MQYMLSFTRDRAAFFAEEKKSRQDENKFAFMENYTYICSTK